MKPKRTILVFDEPANLPALRVVLETRGYRVFNCYSEATRRQVLSRTPVDLQLIGPRIECPLVDPAGPPILVRPSDYSMAQVLEKIRIALIRKRGPKKKVAVPVADSRMARAS